MNGKQNLDELLQQQDLRWKSNSRLNVEALAHEYFGDACESLIDSQSWLELICNEVVLREQLGEKPTLAEYQERFPKIAQELSIQWDIDRLFSNHETTAWQNSTIPSRNQGSSNATQMHGMHFDHRYVIRSELGRGANGVVYEAWDPYLKRRLAIKRLRAGIDASAEQIDRIRTEAEAIAHLRSPYIVQVFDVGEANGLPFLVMEFCEGGSLAQRLDGKPLPPRLAAEITARIAGGVAAAHEGRIIHRDLKPANILLEQPSNWVPKVADFGLAKLLNSDRHATATGSTLGTPAYMAPEQAFGDAKHAGPSTDIYSIGAILYECLTGMPPFQGLSPAETFDLVRYQEPVSIRQLQPKVPADLEIIAAKCLQKDPNRRYGSAMAVAEDLTRFLDGKPILARRVGTLERLIRWRQRNPAVAYLLALSILLLSMLAIGSTVAAVWLKSERDHALRAEAQRRQELYRAYILEARASRLNQQGGQRDFGLAPIRNILQAIPVCELNSRQREELRDEAIASLLRVNARLSIPPMSEQQSPTIEIAGKGDVDIDPLLHWVSYVDSQERTIISTGAREEERLYYDKSSAVQRTGSTRSISPDGQWLVEALWWSQPEASEVRLRVWDFLSNKWVSERQVDFGFGELVFDPARPRCFFRGGDDRIHLIELSSGKEIDSSPPRMQDVRGMAVSPDGQKIAIAAGSNTAEIIDVDSWKTIQSYPGIRKAISVAWDPNDRFVFFGCESGAIFRCEPSIHSAHAFADDRTSPLIGLHISSDGKYFAASYGNNQFEVRDCERNQLLFNCKGLFLRFSKEGSRYAFLNNNQLQIAEIADESAYKVIREVVDGITFTSDGNWILTGGVRGMQIFSAIDLSFAGSFKTDLCGPIAIRPDGREIISFGVFSKIWRWAMDKERKTGSLKIGPAIPVPVSTTLGIQAHYPHYQGRHATWSLDGETLAIADYRDNRVLLMRTEQMDVTKEFPQLNASRVAISPDDKWIASAASLFPNVKVWSTKTGEQVFGVDHANMMAFSPDGRFLAVSLQDAVELYRTTDWNIFRTFSKRDHSLASQSVWPIAFQPSGGLLAHSPGPEQIQLVEFGTGEVVATISGAGSGDISSLCFSPDGTRLAFSTSAQELGIIDLSKLKSDLNELDLQTDKLPDRVKPLTRDDLNVVIDRGTKFPNPERWSAYWLDRAAVEHFKGNASDAVDAVTYGIDRLLPTARADEIASMYTARGKYQQINSNFIAAETDWLEALKAQPGRLDATKYLARLYVLGPIEFRRPAQTMQLAALLSLKPELEQEAMLLQGLAYFRLERWQDCNRSLKEVSAPTQRVMAQLFLSTSLAKCELTEDANQAFSVFQSIEDESKFEMSPLERSDLSRARSELIPQPVTGL